MVNAILIRALAIKHLTLYTMELYLHPMVLSLSLAHAIHQNPKATKISFFVQVKMQQLAI
jgi:hypothetical protein